MSAYRAFILNTNSDGIFTRGIGVQNVRNLPEGEVLIKVKYSSINQADVLALSGVKENSVKYPYVAGVDAAGIVYESTSEVFQKGDEVIVSGFGLGSTLPGGFGQFIKVSASWVTVLPTGLSLRDCMTIGCDGITAAISAMEIITATMPKPDSDIIVSNTLTGSGGLSVALLSKCGYKVTAIVDNNSDDNIEYLKKVGAKHVISADKFIDKSDAPLLEAKYAAGIDIAGGAILSTMLRSIMNGGSVAVSHALRSKMTSLSLAPFISRGINLLGIDGINCSLELKNSAWYKYASDWYLKELSWLCTEISLNELDIYLVHYLKNEIKGRVVINHEL